MEHPLEPLYKQESLIVEHMSELQTFHTTPYMVVENGKVGRKWINKDGERLFNQAGETLNYIKKQIQEYKMKEREEYERSRR